ncbi:MAG: hypothetical protein L0332_23185 [Chloroflexi bacterium]|nr:hypothetical protein [Chloroflexota bacterium]MCI0647446.1 hypothetical protein [Chloroflexota bacterium]MCI0729595.1 hypothetical protein [Chloroflexota bacterium]
MNEKTPELEQAIALAVNLLPLDKVRLVERVMATLEDDLAQGEKRPKRSLYGLWSDVNISAEDINEARQEMWGKFPREDV